MLPQDDYTALDLLESDKFGSNIGNLIYQFSVVRTLLTDGVEFEVDNYATGPGRAAQINEKYDLYILPLADAFRDDFVTNLTNYAKLIEKLTIPVIVTGVGLRAPYEYDVRQGFTFDDAVKSFVSAVLKNSAMLGLRGQLTADYLEHLGFRPDRDFTVIGCPSMYAFGRTLKLRDVTLTPESLVSLNAGVVASPDAMAFLTQVAQDYPNYYFIPQNYKEMLLNYFGMGELKDGPSGFPKDIGSKFYREGRVKFFLNAQSWFDYMQGVSVSVGARLHGNVVATINGTPSLTLASDARMRELSAYHGLPSVGPDEWQHGERLADLLERTDFSLVEKLQPERFDHYIDFLDANGLQHIYADDRHRTDAPLDRLMTQVDHAPAISTITAVDEAERVVRATAGFERFRQREQRLARRGLQRENARIKADIRALGNRWR